MDMTLLPAHLRGLAADVKGMDCFLLSFHLRCPCGNMHFRLEEAVPDEAELAAINAWLAAERTVRRGRIVRYRKDENGQTVLMCRRILFGRWEPFKPLLPPLPCYMDVQSLRGICRGCGKTHLIFDNRLHGMDGLMQEFSGEAMQWQPRWQEVPVPEDSLLRVEIHRDEEMTEADYRRFIPGYTPDTACEAFGHVSVWSETAGERDCLLFESI